MCLRCKKILQAINKDYPCDYIELLKLTGGITPICNYFEEAEKIPTVLRLKDLRKRLVLWKLR